MTRPNTDLINYFANNCGLNCPTNIMQVGHKMWKALKLMARKMTQLYPQFRKKYWKQFKQTTKLVKLFLPNKRCWAAEVKGRFLALASGSLVFPDHISIGQMVLLYLQDQLLILKSFHHQNPDFVVHVFCLVLVTGKSLSSSFGECEWLYVWARKVVKIVIIIIWRMWVIIFGPAEKWCWGRCPLDMISPPLYLPSDLLIIMMMIWTEMIMVSWLWWLWQNGLIWSWGSCHRICLLRSTFRKRMNLIWGEFWCGKMTTWYRYAQA